MSRDTRKIISSLRKLAMAMNEERGFTGKDLDKAKTIATKLYVMHTNREISLSNDEFDVVLDIISYGD